MTKLLFLSGSIRGGSYNAMLARTAMEIAKSKGADVEYIDLKNYELPIYNGDIEARDGVPKAAQDLNKKFREANGFFIASPEYNSSISPLLKNTIDWMSRPAYQGDKPMEAFIGKVAAISAASIGGFGGMRGLVPLRLMLSNIGTQVLPQQVAVSFANKEFNDGGKLNDGRYRNMLEAEVDSFVNITKKLAA